MMLSAKTVFQLTALAVLAASSQAIAQAQTNGIAKRRVDEVLGLVGLTDVAGKRSRGFSLGMRQRLGIAAALLGDPQILMFDEPVNGLDPEGILWIRNLMKALAAEGRTVFVSSHLMSEMETTADRLIVIGRGSLLADCTMEEFIARSSGQTVRVRTPQPDLLAKAVSEAIPEATTASATTASAATATTASAATATTASAATAKPTATSESDGSLTVHGLTAAQVGDLAFDHGVRLHELTVVRASLEAAFMELTADSVEYRAGEGPAEQPFPVSEGVT